MTKQEIIKLIEDKVAPGNDEQMRFFSGGSDSSGTGNNQYRNLANICLRAECCEEIEILIQYKGAKNTKGESWSRSYRGETLANVILNCIDTIKDQSDGDKDCLKDMSLFFGYLYWYSRVWSAKSASKGGKR